MDKTITKNKLYLDGREITYTNEKNLLEVIRKAGIEIPTLCYRPDLNPYGSCRLCVVEIEGRGVQASCSVIPESGLKIRTNTEKTRRVRNISLELLLANHNRECTTCEKSKNCELQSLAQKFGINDVRFIKKEISLPIDDSNPSLIRDPNKCILCGNCVRACKEIQGQNILEFVNRGSKTRVTTAYYKNLNEVDCLYCGQCVSTCPTGALTVKSDIKEAWKVLLDDKKLVIAQIAPAVRVAVGESFGIESGKNTIGLIVAALKKMGFNKVFDTAFAADLTVVEEGAEFITRLKNNKNLPLFTSCCPAWVKLIELKYPQLLDNLSSCKSPQQMFGSIAKEYLSKEYNISPSNLTVVSIMPCTAKKSEAKKDQFTKNGIRDVDIVLTTQELIRMIKEFGIDLNNIQPESMDSPFGELTGAGVIFGTSAGVTESVIRTVYEFVTKNPIDKNALVSVRESDKFKEVILNIDNIKIKVAIISGLKEAEKLVKKILSGKAHYDIVEVMACPGGCINGAGQPQSYKDCSVKSKRAMGLYKIDQELAIYQSHNNPFIKRLYENHLKSPNSKKARELLHTCYKRQSEISAGKSELLYNN